MTDEWLDNICEILRNTTVPQIYGDLISFKVIDVLDDGEPEHEFIGKCALGVISCEVGMTLDYNHQTYDYPDILRTAGVPEELINFDSLPYLDTSINTDGDGRRYITEIDFSDEGCSAFAEYIYKLNDGGLSFKEIADFLETTFGEYDEEYIVG